MCMEWDYSQLLRSLSAKHMNKHDNILQVITKK
jgi:hypothetical protein